MFVEFTARNEKGQNPVEMALKAVVKGCKFELVETPAEAELILTDSPPKALEYLKEHESAVIIVGLDPFRRKDVEPGARSLEKAFAGRVHVRPLLELEGEKNLVICLIEGEFQ
jgi:hypothetical protein